MRFTLWTRLSLSRKGATSGPQSGTDAVSILLLLLLCVTLCIVPSTEASCKTLVAASSKGRQSVQLMRQYIDCMRMVENSYFKRSGRDSNSERENIYDDVYKDMSSTSSPPYSQDDVWKFLYNHKEESLPDKQSNSEDNDWIEYLLLQKSNNILNLHQRRKPDRQLSARIFRPLVHDRIFPERGENYQQ